MRVSQTRNQRASNIRKGVVKKKRAKPKYNAKAFEKVRKEIMRGLDKW